MVIRQIGLDGDELWGGDMGMERESGDGKARGKILKVDARGRWKDTGLHDKRGVTEGKTKNIRVGKRAWGFEKRMEERGGSELARECWREMREKASEGKTGSNWEKERREYFEEKGWRTEEVERRREEGSGWLGEILKKDVEEQRKERWEKIVRLEYNSWYKEIKGEGIPEYLKKGWEESRWKRIARFRLGNEMRGNRYWEKEERIMCRVCGGEREDWEHVWERCRDRGGGRKCWQEMVKEILGEEGEGEWWLREIERERRERGRKGGVREEAGRERERERE